MFPTIKTGEAAHRFHCATQHKRFTQLFPDGENTTEFDRRPRTTHPDIAWEFQLQVSTQERQGGRLVHRRRRRLGSWPSVARSRTPLPPSVARVGRYPGPPTSFPLNWTRAGETVTVPVASISSSEPRSATVAETTASSAGVCIKVNCCICRSRLRRRSVRPSTLSPASEIERALPGLRVQLG